MSSWTSGTTAESETGRERAPFLDEEVSSHSGATPPPRSAAAPPEVESLEDTGLGDAFVTGLVLKTLHVRGALTGRDLADALHLPFAILDELVGNLQKRHFLEVKRATSPNRPDYVFALTSDGRAEAMAELSASHYVGPAPVPLDQYADWMIRQSVSELRISLDEIRGSFSELVVPDELIEALGPAVNSGRSLFLYGESGNGKTRMAHAMAELLGSEFYVPYAVEVDGRVVHVFDAVHHRPLDEAAPEPSSDHDDLLIPTLGYDRRYVRARRPTVVAGGELTLEQLELRYDPVTQVYQAPLQMKANGGVLLIDDLGRQRVDPRELLNRWIVPLERRVDFLKLRSGRTFSVPFECLVMFSTNLRPSDLVEEALLRRIRYKVHVPNPTEGQYREIFERECLNHGLESDRDALTWLWREYYPGRALEPRSCHPRDLLDHICDRARFLGSERALTRSELEEACHAYFVDVDS